MKKIIYFIVGTTILLSIVSCDFFEQEKQPEETQELVDSIGILSQKIKCKLIAQDTLMKDIVNKVDTFAGVLNDIQKENLELREKIEKSRSLEGVWVWMSIAAVVLSIIAILLSLFRKGAGEQEILGIIEDRLNNSQRIRDLVLNVNTLKENQRFSRNTHSISSVSPNEDMWLSQIDKKISDIDNKIKELQQCILKETPVERQDAQQNKQSENRVGYAKIDYENYFTTIYDSNQEGCAFKITFRGATKGEFTIISLDRISSSNDWQQKIECSGVSIKDASNFRVEELGICENIGNNTWQVTKPLKILLLK